MDKAEELPTVKFIELPNDVVHGQIKETFSEQVKENYDIQWMIETGEGWLVKAVRHPTPSFRYKRKVKDERI